jgi:hypothetical protein
VESSDLARCAAEQREIEAMRNQPLWLLMLGHADWEAEKELIRRENNSNSNRMD